jgi:hypothetical protein
MVTVTTSIPDDLAPQAGDMLQLEAQVQADGSFMVLKAIKHTREDLVEGPRMSLTEWVEKYAGSMRLEQGETRESLRDAYLAEKFGS